MAEEKKSESTLSDVGIGLSLFGGVSSSLAGFYSSWQTAGSYSAQSRAVLDQAKIQQAVEAYNQKLTDEAYGIERLNLLKGQERRLSAYHAGYAATGIEMTGSALVAMKEQSKVDALDLSQLDSNADKAALQSQMNSISIMSKANYESKALKRMAKASKISGAINLAGGLLSSFGGAAYKFGTAK